MHAATQAMQPMKASMTVTRNGKTSPRLEITTPAICKSLVTVELEPVVSGVEQKVQKIVKQKR